MPSNKKVLACRVGKETYDAVVALTCGDDAPFESTSEYIYTLIISDLGRRKCGCRTTSEEVRAYLNSEEGHALLKCVARDIN